MLYIIAYSMQQFECNTTCKIRIMVLGLHLNVKIPSQVIWSPETPTKQSQTSQRLLQDVIQRRKRR